ncbi:cytochrome P450 4B1-like [Hypanus sabinus]|uniref:cytochrome P450 4B1-like n=1 Tax=Hypanus sabinus TaxID=79690 RepID=UPI0028C49116|nr:cytochrome P450 4B1-like [Hypanus sabinus]
MTLTEALRALYFPVELCRLVHLIAVFCSVYLLFMSVKLCRRRWKLKEIMQLFPGPPEHWLFGHVLEFPQDGTDLDKTVAWTKQYPYAYPIWFGPFTVFLNINHPDYVKTILLSTAPKDDFVYQFITPWIGDGLLVTSGQKWFRHRRLLTPGFHYDVLKPYVKLVADSAKSMLDKWERFCTEGSNTLELYQHVSLMTLDSILKCAFSYNSNCQVASDSSYIQAVYRLCFLSNQRFRIFPYHSNLIYYLSPHGFRFRKACNLAHRHTEEVIRQRKETLKDKKELGKIKDRRYLDFLDILLCARDEDGKGLSDEEIRAEVDTFMFEGHDTTASGISWLLYCLAQHPEHQQKCREEIQQLLMQHKQVEWDMLSKMPYITMCIKESLRLCPPVPGIARRLNKPLTFFDGRTVPEGCLVGVSIYCIHRNSMIWSNPEVFDPLRFSPENSAHRHSHAFIPFSAGSRNCIGQQFAMNEMKVTIALILSRFELEVDASKPPMKIPQLVLRSKNGIHLKLKKIKSSTDERKI